VGSICVTLVFGSKRLLALFFCDFWVNFISFASGEKEELRSFTLESDAACTADACFWLRFMDLAARRGNHCAVPESSIDELQERLLLDLIFYGFLLYKVQMISV
jgi:hypothetical protein